MWLRCTSCCHTDDDLPVLDEDGPMSDEYYLYNVVDSPETLIKSSNKTTLPLYFSKCKINISSSKFEIVSMIYVIIHAKTHINGNPAFLTNTCI